MKSEEDRHSKASPAPNSSDGGGQAQQDSPKN